MLKPARQTMQERFAATSATAPVWEPTTTDAPAAVGVTVEPLSIAFETTILEVLTRPLGIGESSFNGHRRKEGELIAMFDQLSAFEARALHKRLENPRPDDRLAAGFARLISERRSRLLAYLADARRREAIRARRT